MVIFHLQTPRDPISDRVVLEGHGGANLRIGAAVQDPRQQGQEDRETHADQAQHLDAVPRRSLRFRYRDTIYKWMIYIYSMLDYYSMIV